MTTEISKPQDTAADFLATYFYQVVVSAPNAHGNVMLTGLMQDIEALKWIVRPNGTLIFNSPEHEATDVYLRKLREGSL